MLMPENTFKLLVRFLSLREAEVSGQAMSLDSALVERLRLCAHGALKAEHRMSLCEEIRNNPAALTALASEIPVRKAAGGQVQCAPSKKNGES